MVATLTRRGSTVDAIDLFCGYGGSSQGIHAAGAEVKLAANHNEKSIACHAANYPDTDHRRADLADPDSADYVDPATLPPATFLWASPSCKFHSPANAKKLYLEGPQARLFGDDDFDQVAYANSERSRVTMLCPLRYAAKHTPQLVIVENVVEAACWGPARDGSTFRWWLDEWTKLGYEHEVCFLNSMFFPPCPQSRDRMYVVFWRKGNIRPDLDYRPKAMCVSDRCSGRMVEAVQTWKPRTAAWPLRRWGKYGAQYTYTCPDCHARVEPLAFPAYSAIDWSNLGPRINERASLGMKDLAGSTMDRIARGVTKFRKGPPIIIPAKAIWGTDRTVLQPLATQTGQQDKALVCNGALLPIRSGRPRANALFGQTATVVGEGSHHALATEGCVLPAAGNTFERPGQTRARHLADPLFTQHTTRAFGFAHLPFITEMRGGGSKKSGQHPVTDPLHAVTAGGYHHGLASPALFSKINGGATDTSWHHAGEPLNTVTSRDTHGLVVLPWVDQWQSDPVGVMEQLATVMTHARHALATMDPELEPISDEDLGNIRFRMLQPDPELRRAMAFAEDYILLGSATDMTSGLGNAVTPPVASLLTERALATLR